MASYVYVCRQSVVHVAFFVKKINNMPSEKINSLIGKVCVFKVLGNVTFVNAVAVIVYEAHTVLGGYVVNVLKVV